MNDVTSISALHSDIYYWSTSYNGISQIKVYQSGKEDIVVPHIHFLDLQGNHQLLNIRTKNVSWFEFFSVFDQLNLALLYVEEIDRVNPDSLTNAYQFVDRRVLEKSENEVHRIMDDFMYEYTQSFGVYTI